MGWVSIIRKQPKHLQGKPLFKWLACIFLFLTSFLSAQDPVTRTLDSIAYRSQLGSTVGLIKLSDGSIWKWSPDTYSENLLRKWAEGDEIVIRAINQPGFILQNLKKPHFSPTVALSFNSYPLFPYIEQFDEESKVILLSDGSLWELLYDFNIRTLVHWAIGDRIIAVRGASTNFELINLDIPYEKRNPIERNVQVTRYIPLETPLLAEDLLSKNEGS